MHIPRTRSARSTRPSRRSISARRRRMSCSSPSPTATSTRSRAPIDAAPAPKPTLRLASLAALRHPYSIDLYLERVCAEAKLVVARVLGGADYWRYGVDELAALARQARDQARAAARRPARRRAARRGLDRCAATRGRRIWRYFDEGGPRNMAACLALSVRASSAPAREAPHARAGQRLRPVRGAPASKPAPDAPRALIVFYRSIYLAGDLAPIVALRRRFDARGFATTAVYVTSLKDEAALAPLRRADRERGLRRRAQRDRLLRPARRAREPFSMPSTRRCCRSCWRASGSRPGALRRAASGPPISPCMSRCRRSTAAS